MHNKLFPRLCVVIALTQALVRGTDFSCGGDGPSCAHQTLSCSPGEACSFSCFANASIEDVTIAPFDSCFHSLLTCAADQPCSLSCSGEGACHNITLDASDASALTLEASTLGDLSVRTLRYATVLCPIGGNCDVSCGSHACQYTYFNAFQSNLVSFSDQYTSSFRHSTINATQAEYLSITTKVFHAYYGATIYCPDNGPKRSNSLGYTCTITTNTQWWTMYNSQIYAVEGRNDLEIAGDKLGFGHEPIVLYCGLNYGYSCDLKYDSYLSEVQCNESTRDGDFCETFLLTDAPTNLPTANTFYPTTQPTLMPTIQTTILTTRMNSMEPTFDPSSEPSLDPTVAPTTSETSGTPITSISKPEAPRQEVPSTEEGSNGSEGNLKKFRDLGAILLIGLVLVWLVLLVLTKLWHEKNQYRGLDKPRFFRFAKALLHIGNVLSDAVFGVMLFFEKDLLWIYCAAFVLVPHVLSILICLRWVRKNKHHTVNLTKYLARYDWVIILVSLFTGMYATIDLLSSKLFYWNVFNLQIKQNQYDKLQSYRFWNTKVLQSFVQLGIQIIYIYRDNSALSNIIVLTAALFSIVSIFGGIWDQIICCKEWKTSRDSRYIFGRKKQFSMKITSKEFGPKHKFAKQKVEATVARVLEMNPRAVEVFYCYNIHHGIVCLLEMSDIGATPGNGDSPDKLNLASVANLGSVTPSAREASQTSQMDRKGSELSLVDASEAAASSVVSAVSVDIKDLEASEREQSQQQGKFKSSLDGLDRMELMEQLGREGSEFNIKFKEELCEIMHFLSQKSQDMQVSVLEFGVDGTDGTVRIDDDSINLQHQNEHELNEAQTGTAGLPDLPAQEDDSDDMDPIVGSGAGFGTIGTVGTRGARGTTGTAGEGGVQMAELGHDAMMGQNDNDVYTLDAGEGDKLTMTGGNATHERQSIGVDNTEYSSDEVDDLYDTVEVEKGGNVNAPQEGNETTRGSVAESVHEEGDEAQTGQTGY